MFNLKFIPLFVALGSIVSCAQVSEVNQDVSGVENATINGVVSYRERIALPENAILTIQLQDTAKADAAATVIAEEVMTLTSATPWDFELTYNKLALQEKGRYTLSARIEVAGQLRFINTSSIAAFASEQPIRILLSSVSQSATFNQDMLQAHSWALTELNGEIFNPSNEEAVENIVFNKTDARVNGFSGCNRFSAGYTLSETELNFLPMMSTMMACAEDNSESAYLLALSKVAAYKIDKKALILVDDQAVVLLKFEIMENKAVK